MAEVRTSEILNWTVGKFTNDVLEAAEKVVWKNEDDVDGVPIGPIWVESKSTREKAPSWYPVADARALAEELGVPCEEW